MFLVNSRHPLVCAPRRWLPTDRAPFSRSYGGILPSSFNTILSNAWVCSTSPPVSVSGTVHMRGLFPGTAWQPGQSDKPGHTAPFVTTRGPRNINRVPIDYAFRPRLRGRLTLRGLALRRNPWTFGGRGSRSPVATHVSILTSDTSTDPHKSASSAYGTLRYRYQVPGTRNQEPGTTTIDRHGFHA